MNDLTGPEDLITRSDAVQLNFLRDELAICHTLVEIATSDHGADDHSGFGQALGNAEAGYQTVARFALNLRNPAHREEIQSGLRELRAVLDRLR